MPKTTRNTDVLPRLLSSREMARILGCCEKTVERRCNSGRIPHVFKVGGQWRILEDDFDAWISGLAQGPRSEVVS